MSIGSYINVLAIGAIVYISSATSYSNIYGNSLANYLLTGGKVSFDNFPINSNNYYLIFLSYVIFKKCPDNYIPDCNVL